MSAASKVWPGGAAYGPLCFRKPSWKRKDLVSSSSRTVFRISVGGSCACLEFGSAQTARWGSSVPGLSQGRDVRKLKLGHAQTSGSWYTALSTTTNTK